MSLKLIEKFTEYYGTKYGFIPNGAFVNGMTCGKNGKDVCKELFPDALWVESESFLQEIAAYKKDNDAMPKAIFCKNKGLVIAGDDEKKVVAANDKINSVLKKFYAKKGVETKLLIGKKDEKYVYETAPGLRTLLGQGKVYTVVSLPPFKIADGAVFTDSATTRLTCPEISKKCDAEVVCVEDKAVFCAAPDYETALELAAITQLEALVEQLSKACGGINYLRPEFPECIGRKGRLYGKVAIVTGGAQGFGFGIAEELAAEDAVVAIADMNLEGANKAAEKICKKFGANKAFALAVNISSEESVEKMFRDLVLKTGGIDLLVANAGVVRSGSVKSLSKKDWDFVTDINYSGYFLCAKYAAQVMSVQNKNGNRWTDIVQVNSKSGLVGSNRNGAYAGSKFGTIGLTQSFALELVDDHIKVNSVCPGNFFDGPLWSDPKNGLFVQYLESKKVPGAKTLEDVKKFYESKIPMNRGCFPADVAKAIMYTVEQQYETGQAIPVTGGQVMMN
jgi:sorbitol-6-phosphate 2-dehydrogenase